MGDLVVRDHEKYSRCHIVISTSHLRYRDVENIHSTEADQGFLKGGGKLLFRPSFLKIASK